MGIYAVLSRDTILNRGVALSKDAMLNRSVY